ncbi:hypothetical protein BGX20_005717, partial [Mortierella sp. AD010]
MPELEAQHELETTSLLHETSPTGPKPLVQSSRPSYWFAVLALVFLGFHIGPLGALNAPFLRELFCERGIPEGLIPNRNSTNRAIGDIPGNDDGHCDTAEFSAAIARFMSVTITLTAISGKRHAEYVTLSVRYWSGLSDRIGRKRTMQLCALGSLSAHLIYVLVRANRNVNLYFIWVGDIVEGVAGSVATFETLAHTYVTDVTNPDERTVIFGRLGAGFLIGSIVGISMGSFAAKMLGLTFVFVWMIPGFAALSFLFVSSIPESLSEANLINNRMLHNQPTLVQFQQHESDQKSLRHSWTQVVTSGKDQLKTFIKGFVPDQLPNRLPGKYSIAIISVIFFLTSAATVGTGSQVMPYLLFQFHWTETELSLFMILTGSSQFLYYVFLLPFIRRFAPKGAHADPAVSINFDLKVAALFSLLGGVSYLLIAVATTNLAVFISVLVGSLFLMFPPAIRSVVSQSVAPEQIGVTFGSLSMIPALASILAPLPASWIYGATVEFWPTALFYISSVVAM